MNQNYLKAFLFLALTFALAAIFVVVGEPAIASGSSSGVELVSQESTSSTLASCRYGTVSSPDNLFAQDIGIGWVHNFRATSYADSESVEYVATVRLSQVRDERGIRTQEYELTSPETTDELLNMVNANRGRLWLIGNEVDRIHVQDDLMPEIYAIAYHDLYHLIKKTDPTAQVAPSGLVQVTPGRLQYLDIVWESFLNEYGTPMPVDVWNMHIYILPERHLEDDPDGTPVPSLAGIALGTEPSLAIYHSDLNPANCSREDVYCFAEHDDVEIFKHQVLAMRQWMKDHGQQDKPLILSEFSILFPYRETSDPEYDPVTCPTCYTLLDEYSEPFSPERVTAYMNKTLTYLEQATDQNLGYPEDNYRLVQKWNWYSLTDVHPAASSSLVEGDLSGLTMMGETYKNRIALRGFDLNLHLETVHVSSVITTGTTATAPLSVTFRNNGNTRISSPFQVTFYSDAALTSEIGSVTISNDVLGCATHPYTAGIVWNGLQPGTHRFWVHIDSGPDILETREDDNVGTGIVYVNPDQLFLPAVSN